MSDGNGRSERRRLPELVSARMDAADVAKLDAAAARYGMQRGEYIRRVLKQSIEMTPETRFLAEEIAAARLLAVELKTADGEGVRNSVGSAEREKVPMADRMFQRFQARLVKRGVDEEWAHKQSTLN